MTQEIDDLHYLLLAITVFCSRITQFHNVPGDQPLPTSTPFNSMVITVTLYFYTISVLNFTYE